MRKDEIEDRIVRLEGEVRALKADHRDGVDTILAEMQKFQGKAMEDRIVEVRDRIIEGYQAIFLDMMLENARHNLDAQCLDPCARDRRKECQEFLLARLRVAVQKFQDPDIVLPRTRETMSDRTLVKKAPFLVEGECRACFPVYLNEKDQIKKMVEMFSRTKAALPAGKQAIFLSDLPEDPAVAGLVEPLSHEHRFAMLRALAQGSMSFKELGTLTGSKGGHLLYHLNRLTGAGLVRKAEGGKRYAITDRGLGVMDLVRKLYAGRA